MAESREREPTIEQKSHFTSKDKSGKDIEFEAILRFYVSPTGEVTLNAPGATQTSRTTSGRDSSSSRTPPPPPPPGDSNTVISQSDTPVQSPGTGKTPAPGGDTDRRDSSVDRGSSKKVLTDETIDRAFPRGPEPSQECAIKQFIPDPCRAVDDAIKSIRGIYHSYFVGTKCPPPENADNGPEKVASVRDIPKPADYFGNADVNETEREEMIENEQKFDM